MDQVNDKLMLDKGLRHKNLYVWLLENLYLLPVTKKKKQQSIYILLCYVKNIYDGWRTCVLGGNQCTLCEGQCCNSSKCYC